ncbi:MAG: GntR family transcriptional regulator [Gemmatimonadetes bacterium]|nr:GntR family transcriptional regulator [Gemmatimonadota bacterium]
MFEAVDPRAATPLYAQIADGVRLAIARGELASGDGLPSVRQLATELRINPATVSQAYRELEAEGLVEMRQGAGSFIADVSQDVRARDRTQRLRAAVRALLAEATRLGASPQDLRAALDAELGRSPK